MNKGLVHLAGTDFVHPYIPNSNPTSIAAMLEEIGVSSIEELFQSVPEHLRYQGGLGLPEGCNSEIELRRIVAEILKKNRSFEPHRNFRGGGCWQGRLPRRGDRVPLPGSFQLAPPE